MQDAVDTHYVYVTGRISTINPSRQFGGVMDAQDWPPQKVISEAFYLLALGEMPINSRASSAAVPVNRIVLQWTWLILGQDLTAGTLGKNRGNRYRINEKMKDELRQALYPLFTQKNAYQVDSNGVLTGTPLAEHISWTPAAFMPRRHDDSGVVYEAATTYLIDMTPLITS